MYNHKIIQTRLKKPARASLYYVISGALTKLIGVLSTPIFTRLLSGEEYGSYTLYMSYLGLLTTVSAAAISQQVLYRGFEKYKGEKAGFLVSSLAVGESFSLAVSLVLLMLSPYLSLSYDMLFALSVQLLLDTAINLALASSKHEYGYARVILINLSTAALTPLLAASLTIGGGLGYRGRVYALLILSAAVALPIVIKIMKRARLFDKSKAKYVIKNSFPLIPGAASGAVSAEIDKLMVSAYLGPAALAKYSIAHTVGLGLGFITSSVSSALYPWIIRKLSDGKTDDFTSLLRPALRALCALVCMLCTLVPEIFGLLAPKEYGIAKYSSVPLALCAVPSFASALIGVCIVYAGRSPYTTLSAFCSVMANLALSTLLIPNLDFIGAGISLLLSNLLSLFVNYILLSRCNMASLIPKSSILTPFLYSSLLSALAALFYPYLHIRILLLCIPAVWLLNSLFEIKGYITE